MIPDILRWFEYNHLAAGSIRETSKMFHDLAHEIVDKIPMASNERTVALRKLLEAKDAAVRAKMYELQLS